MRRRLRRISPARDESGMTLVEMMVAATMSVIIVGATCSMMISAVRDQPSLSRKAQNVTTARYQLERIVRELRNGVTLVTKTPSQVTMVARVRRVACGGAPQTDPAAEPVQCRVTYTCTGTSCTRSEATPEGTPVGTPAVALSGIGDTNVFCFVPSSEPDPTECGDPQEGEGAVDPTYVGVSLEVPNPEGRGLLTISDGATLRAAAFSRQFSTS